jgi:GGDEF domain-containing protein
VQPAKGFVAESGQIAWLALVALIPVADDHPMRDSQETGDELAPVVDEVTGLANRRGFLEMLRMEERRRARYGGSPTLMMVDVERSLARLAPADRPMALLRVAAVLADATRDTDTLGRVDDYRFALLAIGAGTEAAPIVGRLRLFLEMRGVEATVTAAGSGTLDEAWQDLAGPPRQALRLVRDGDEPG